MTQQLDPLAASRLVDEPFQIRAFGAFTRNHQSHVRPRFDKQIDRANQNIKPLLRRQSPDGRDNVAVTNVAVIAPRDERVQFLIFDFRFLICTAIGNRKSKITI